MYHLTRLTVPQSSKIGDIFAHRISLVSDKLVLQQILQTLDTPYELPMSTGTELDLDCTPLSQHSRRCGASKSPFSSAHTLIGKEKKEKRNQNTCSNVLIFLHPFTLRLAVNV